MLYSNFNDYLYSLASDFFEGKEKDIPEWISQHPAIKNREVNKIFPSIGLPNFEEKADISLDEYKGLNLKDINSAVYAISEQCKEVIEDLESVHKNIFSNKLLNLQTMKAKPTRENETLADIVAREIKPISAMVAEISNIIFEFYTSFRDPDSVINISEDGKVKLLFNKIIKDPKGKRIAVPGESLFKIYNKIRDIVNAFFNSANSGHQMKSLDELPEIQKFNNINVPLNKLKVVFSSAGEQGAWDIATMSMRGLTSCQDLSKTNKAEGAEFKPCLIGSIASKFVGIIYLTTGEDFAGRGAKYIKRCIVRFGVDMGREKNKREVIILDRMYDSYSPVAAEAFKRALGKRTRVPILDFSSGLKNTPEDMGDIHLIDENLPKIYDKNIVHTLPADKLFDFNKNYGLSSYLDTPFGYIGEGIHSPKNTDKQDVENRKKDLKIRLNVAVRMAIDSLRELIPNIPSIRDFNIKHIKNIVGYFEDQFKMIAKNINPEVFLKRDPKYIAYFYFLKALNHNFTNANHPSPQLISEIEKELKQSIKNIISSNSF